MTTALVTGSTGFIGSRLCRALLDKGFQVRAFHRSTSQLQLLEGLAVEHANGDLTRPETLADALQGVDVLFHTAAMLAAAEKPGQMYTINVEGTRSLLKAALQAGVQRVVHTSSVAALGIPELWIAENAEPALINENHTWKGSVDIWPYGYSKYAAELEVQKIVASGLDVVIVNPSLVYGPGDMYKQTSSLVVQMAQRRVPVLLEGGINVVHVDDVVTGQLAALEHGRRGERYILGGDNLLVADLIRLSAEVVGCAAPDMVAPAGLLRALARPIGLLQPFITAAIPLSMLRLAGYHFYYDNHKAQDHLGWLPSFTARQALMEAYEWFKQQGAIQAQ
jgi:dihydroflavonol-4-reductase